MNSALAELSRVCPSSVYFLSVVKFKKVILTKVNLLWVRGRGVSHYVLQHTNVVHKIYTFALIVRIILEN